MTGVPDPRPTTVLPCRPGRTHARALRRIARIAAACVLVSIAGAAAGVPPSPTIEMQGASRLVPRRGGVLRIVQEHASTLDPKGLSDVYSATVSQQIFRGLLSNDANLTPTPDIARAWTISRDGRHYAFELNRGVRFHNGREVVAQDFVYTFHRIFRPGESSGLGGQYLSGIEGADAYHAGRARRITGLSAPSRYRLEIRLSRTDATFLWALAMIQAAVVPREVVAGLGDDAFGRHPVGCGPFRLVSNRPGRIKLAAFEGFYRGRAWLDSLFFVTPSDFASNQGLDGLLRGQYDLVSVPGFRRQEVRRAPGARLLGRRELDLAFVGMNTRIPPFDEPGVRRAVALSIDREALMRIDPLEQVSATGLLPPGVACYSPAVRIYPFDLSLARKALAEAGHPGGAGLPTLTFLCARRSARHRMADSLMVATWRKAGLPVKAEWVDWVEYARRLDRKDVPFFHLTWVADVPDPDSFMGSLLHSGSPNNSSDYANPEVDSLLALGRATVDPRSRQPIYGRIEQIVLRDAPIVPLFSSASAYAIRDCFHGLELTPLGISCVDLSRVWREPDDHVSQRIQ